MVGFDYYWKSCPWFVGRIDGTESEPKRLKRAYFRWRIRARILRFFRPTLRRPVPRRLAAMASAPRSREALLRNRVVWAIHECDKAEQSVVTAVGSCGKQNDGPANGGLSLGAHSPISEVEN